MPQLEGADEITLGTWRLAPGDRVGAGDVIAEALTDKVNVEIESPHTGRIEELLVAEGASVRSGDVIARIRRIGAEAQI